MEGKHEQLFQGETSRILVEFLEVAINFIVFIKGVYPVGAFERRRYMNLVVQRAMFPELREYIHCCITALHPFIQKGMVERVGVIFCDANHAPLERFIFKVSLNQFYGSNVEEQNLQFSLRSFLMKLSVMKPLTKILPRDCRWEVMAYFHAVPQVITSMQAKLWIPTDMKQWQQPPLITPIKSMESHHLGLQLYLEHPSLSEPIP